MASLILVGITWNYWVALACRALGGALNRNIGAIQTMVSELIGRPEHEPRAYAIIPFVWSIGTIIGPNMQPGKAHRQFDQAFEQSLLVTSGAAASAGVNLRAESYGTFNRVHLHNDKSWNVQADGSSCT
ncbi:Tetracycline resistance protein TetA/multidrug resistance protein MdtG [Penicillium vulpinum]|uniref:Tetracycline resistance protein TetA/multidrug resistance protein MdtG n=1 Tax=Penicillium vulpinum TaxID=29845 RepID=UPI0025481640|nr:Tetracycline resistance protein TetA/multidrug resistance protein MdtG [Penicillium vulpinum]KAJ5951805.1 Tetracycline resistance protein TetA/multidrug resistance protein MdtG [Penicillium vulpinum]